MRRWALGQSRRLRLVSLLLPQATWWHCWFQFGFCSMDWGSQRPTLASTSGSCPRRNFSPGSHREISNICIAMVSASQWKPPWKTFLSPCLLLTECPVFSPVTEGQPSSPSAPQLASREALTLVRASYDVWHSGKLPWVLLWLWGGTGKGNGIFRSTYVLTLSPNKTGNVMRRFYLIDKII